jgi:hypothetical protein
MMKVLLPVCLILLNTVVYSQRFHGGILAGFTAAQVDGDSYAGYNKVGLQGGVFISTSLASRIDARLEIKYASRGARNPASDDNTGAYKLGLHYIDLPVLLAVRIKKLGAVELGLVPGYLFAVRGEDDKGKLPQEYLIAFRKFDLGTLVGILLNITPKIAFNMRYSYSILSIRDLESTSAGYSWFGKLFGHTHGDFNNYLTFGLNYLIK